MLRDIPTLQHWNLFDEGSAYCLAEHPPQLAKVAIGSNVRYGHISSKIDIPSFRQIAAKTASAKPLVPLVPCTSRVKVFAST
jgi:hypothetical protein